MALESPLSKFLRSFDLVHPNPFKNKNFFVNCMEVYAEVKKYKVMDVEIDFDNENKICTISTRTSLILSAYITSCILSDGYGFDPNAEFYLNDKKVLFEKSLDSLKCFKSIINQFELGTVEIRFSKSARGENAFNYHRCSRWFTVDQYRDDGYY